MLKYLYIIPMMTREKNRVCGCNSIHPEVIVRAEKAMPADGDIVELSSFFKICGDPTRMKILYALFATEMCVCDIAGLLGMTMSSISHQLRVLKQARMVSSRKEGQMVFYSATDEHVKDIITQGMRHMAE